MRNGVALALMVQRMQHDVRLLHGNVQPELVHLQPVIFSVNANAMRRAHLLSRTTGNAT